MSAAALLMLPPRSASLTRARLWTSFAVSALIHGLALMIFAGLLLPNPAPVWTRLGEPATVQVILTRPQPPTPEAPAPVDVVPPAIAAIPESTAAIAIRPATTPETPVPAARSDPRPPAAALTGTPSPSEPTPDAVPDDAPAPPGDIAVGAANNPDALGRTTALRLAQRFPQRISTPARLKAPLVMAYPPRAARAWREARIAALLVVDADGKILETTLTPEDPLFAPTVRDALDGAVLLPAEIDGVAVRYWVVLEFIFSMRQLHQPNAGRSAAR
ncbi:MAG: energy transducer TonB [Betaproteobacteria bacterium]